MDRLRNKIQNAKIENIETVLETNGPDLLRWGLAAACATLVKPGMAMGNRDAILRYFPMIEIKEIHTSIRGKK